MAKLLEVETRLHTCKFDSFDIWQEMQLFPLSLVFVIFISQAHLLLAFYFPTFLPGNNYHQKHQIPANSFRNVFFLSPTILNHPLHAVKPNDSFDSDNSENVEGVDDGDAEDLSLEDMVKAMENEENQKGQQTRVDAIQKKRDALKRKADAEYEAYWKRMDGTFVLCDELIYRYVWYEPFSVGVNSAQAQKSRNPTSKDRAIMNAYYSVRRNESLASKVGCYLNDNIGEARVRWFDQFCHPIVLLPLPYSTSAFLYPAFIRLSLRSMTIGGALRKNQLPFAKPPQPVSYHKV